MQVVKEWAEFGHHFVIEKLAEPKLVGAGERHFRLYDNGAPAYGGQWHYTLEDAEAQAKYRLRDSYVRRIEYLERRVNDLQRELHLCRTEGLAR